MCRGAAAARRRVTASCTRRDDLATSITARPLRSRATFWRRGPSAGLVHPHREVEVAEGVVGDEAGRGDRHELARRVDDLRARSFPTCPRVGAGRFRAFPFRSPRHPPCGVPLGAPALTGAPFGPPPLPPGVGAQPVRPANVTRHARPTGNRCLDTISPSTSGGEAQKPPKVYPQPAGMASGGRTWSGANLAPRCLAHDMAEPRDTPPRRSDVASQRSRSTARAAVPPHVAQHTGLRERSHLRDPGASPFPRSPPFPPRPPP